ncbi:pentapeptide repeat-containing protein [Acaryochloris sp. IP29b_bin.148]|uniref:pentapeptide repeat-containing protein n=1 Tax=Acaryochloris sp. IP29b_bin.148 TaxID=2969218 RepID=UPI002629DFA0|nr:pentapeptide repeat-containing protein [Acaryochloris sp. IP29b_bin.148]
MANLKQVEVLKQGAKTWNNWRKESPDEKLDLSGAELNGSILIGADLRNANLRYANLISANLQHAILTGADLHYASLINANLNCASLRNADLSNAILNNTDLSKANLSVANLNKADLYKANLYEAKLMDAKLCRANLKNVQLSKSNLSRANLLGSKLQNVILTGSCIQDWNINKETNVDGLVCDYIYLREENQERRPLKRNFDSGEFVVLVQKALRTIDFIFIDGIDWLVFFQTLQEVRQQYPRSEVGLQAIEKKGAAFVIRLETAHNADQSAIESLTTELYDTKLELREAQGKITVLREMSDVLEQLAGAAMNTPTNQTNNYGNVYGVQHSGSGNIQAFTQNIGNNLNEISKLINTLREAVQTFPDEQKEIALGELEDIESELQNPENIKPERINRRLKGLLAAGAATATFAGTAVTGAADFTKKANEFTGNVLELSKKIGIELVEPKQKN